MRYVSFSGAAAQDDARQARPRRSAVLVLDTNVVLDWLVFGDRCVSPLLAAWATGSVQCIACAPMRAELERQLGSKRLARWSPDATTALAAYDARVEIVSSPTRSAPPGLVCSDPDDQPFVDLALERTATFLLTHDRALLRLARRARRHGLEIAEPDKLADWVPHPG